MDPFAWSVEDVVQALCGRPCPWAQDAASLAARIREEEVDGSLFLTLEKTFSKEDLMNCLGIRKYRHQSRLLEELNNLRSQSGKYKEWHRDWLKKKHSHEFAQRSHFSDEAEPSSDIERGQPPALNASRGNGEGSQQTNGQTVSTPQSLPNAEPEDDINAEGGDETSGLDVTERDTLAIDVMIPATVEEHPTKRRRVAPLNVSQELSNTRPRDTNPWERSQPWSYLGQGSIPSYLIKSPILPISTRVMDLGNDNFVVRAPNHFPPGRRLAINRVMKQVFRKNGRQESLIRSGATPMRSPTPSDNGDEVLDLADLPDWDERTLREIAEEEEDNERARQLERNIPHDEVAAIIAEAIEEMTEKWQEKKQHKLERKAYQIWNAATRKDSRLKQIIEARRKITSYDSRIKQLSDRIQSEQWQDRKDIKIQAQCLEQSVEDRSSQLWLVKTLELKQQPPKPHLLPPPPERQIPDRVFDPNDEVLTSSDEEDDFIVRDDVRTVAQSLTQPNRPGVLATPVRAEPEMVVDLTHSMTHHRQKPRTIIDLTTPVKADYQSTPERQKSDALTNEQPSLEDLDIEAIAAVERNHWAKHNDRWRLAIYVLRKLTHDRRMAVFNMIMSSDDDELWTHSILNYTSQPFSTPEEVLDAETGVDKLDLTRAFYCFAKCKHYKEHRLTPLVERDIKKLIDFKQLFTVFCNFIRTVVDLFPQDSQILNTDDLDGDLLADELIEEEDEPSQGLQADSPLRPRVVRKEVVQNKDALNLRERQAKRDSEQEARRLKLRQNLASSGVISQDRSRLIINESKEEGQSLIYVNEEIGKSIKDHQVDGVRFLWNQIVQDPDIRQGCLLAHTMGLGKTMQVITFLVAIAEASSSDSSQIPKDLHSARTLVLCPSGLVENWMDEFLQWAPEGVLGTLAQLDSSYSIEERKSIIQTWAKNRGVLIIGYNMFTKAMEMSEEMDSILLETPTIVVADEAHKLKNRETKLNKACSSFTTKSRIALTGSPLANNVEEYYSMIDWVAPNYLGPLSEFREIYVRDIEAGFFRDSTSWQKRRALIRLQALTRTVAPKINRATVKTCLANDLPPKSEYVIHLTPTALQLELYNMYITALGAVSGDDDYASGQVFNTINDLALICNHPKSFKSKLLKVKKDPDMHEHFPHSMLEAALRRTTGSDEDHPSLSLKTEFLTIVLDEARRVNDKVLVFSHSLHTLDYLETLLRTQKRLVCRLDGSTKIQDRQELIKSFNRGNIEVFLISTRAGGVGLNIYGANRVVVFDFRWNPVEAQQAVGRAYRLGQIKKVFVYHFMLAGTFEEDIHNRAVFKTQLAQRVVDKANPISWSQRDAKLIHHIRPCQKKDLGSLAGKDHILDRLIAFRRPGGPPEQLISSIVPTDTFEEEDPEHALTDRERLEADHMVSMNRLRHTDPQQFERMRVEQSYQNLANAHLYPPFAAPVQVPPSSAPVLPAVAQRPLHLSGTLPNGRSPNYQTTSTWRVPLYNSRPEGPERQGFQSQQQTPHSHEAFASNVSRPIPYPA